MTMLRFCMNGERSRDGRLKITIEGITSRGESV